MKIRAWKRIVSLCLAVLLSASALTLEARADQEDIKVPDFDEIEEAVRQAQQEMDAIQAEYANEDADEDDSEDDELPDWQAPDFGTAGSTFELPMYDGYDDEDAEDSEPINFQRTLAEDFSLNEQGEFGGAAKFPTHVAIPAKADMLLESQYAKMTAETKAAFRSEMKQLYSEIKSAKEEASKSEAAYESFMKDFDQKLNKIKNKYCKPKQKGSCLSKTRALKGEQSALKTNMTNSQTALKTKTGQVTELKETTRAAAPKAGKGYKLRKGALVAISVIVAVIGLIDMWENPEVGYKSAYLEDLANFCRAGSNVFGLLSWYPPFAALALGFAIGDMVMTSETMKAILNKYLPDLGWLDENTRYRNEKQQELFLKFWNWWYREYKEQEQETDMRKNAHLINKVGTNSIGGMLPAGVYEIVRGATASANHVNAYKPNIYLYPETETEMTVSFGHPTALTVTDPIYPRTGWRVTAAPDGTLRAAEGEYGFLFYEAVTSDRYYQREEGYVVPAQAREETFTAILEGYGLNRQEIDDFNAYWCDKLEPGWDYAMYPQLTEIVDEAMPMTVTPAPDSILRLWFAFVKDEVPAAEAAPQPFQRAGTVVVEWGGLFLDA